MWRSYYNIPKAIFYLLKGDYRLREGFMVWVECLGLQILKPWGEKLHLGVLLAAHLATPPQKGCLQYSIKRTYQACS